MNNKDGLHNDNYGFSDTAGKVTNGLVYLLIGGGIGAALALLFAPKSGVALRGDIADISRRGYDEALTRAQSIGDKSAEIYQSVKDSASDAYDFATAKMSTGKDEITGLVEKVAPWIEDKGNASVDEAAKALKPNGQVRRSPSIM